MKDRGIIAIAIIIVVIVLTIMAPTGALIDIYSDSTHIGQRTGINIIAGDNLSVTGVDDPTNSRANLTINLTDKQAFGSVTIGANATTTAVTHGLGTAPTQVVISPTSDVGALRHWVSEKNSTTFSITRNATTTSSIGFDWLVTE